VSAKINKSIKVLLLFYFYSHDFNHINLVTQYLNSKNKKNRNFKNWLLYYGWGSIKMGDENIAH